MDCKNAKRFMTPWIDRELQAATGQELLSHLERCPDCKREFELERRLKAMLAERVPRLSAPPHLYQLIVTALDAPPVRRSWGERLSEVLLVRPRIGFAAIAAAALVVMTTVTSLLYSTFQPPPPLIADLVQHHTMCAVEIASDQPEKIRAWFAGQVNFAVDVPRLDRFHSRLLGAHLCQAADRKIAYLVYDLNGTRMSVCLLTGSPVDLDRLKRVSRKNAQFYTAAYRNQNLVLWSEGNRICSFIGPVKQDDLLTMASGREW